MKDLLVPIILQKVLVQSYNKNFEVKDIKLAIFLDALYRKKEKVRFFLATPSKQGLSHPQALFYSRL